MGLFSEGSLTKDPLWNELTNASDRTTAIVGAALIEDKLSGTIKSRLRQDKDTLNKMLKPSGPVGSLGPKADLAYLLSMFSKETRDDLAEVSSIRNKFAHWSTFTTFDTKEIRQSCERITFLQRLPDTKQMGWQSISAPFPNGYAKYSFIAFSVLISDWLSALAEKPDEFTSFPSEL